MHLLLFTGLCFLTSLSFGQNQITWGPSADVASSTFGYNFPRIEKNAAGDPLISWNNNNKMYFARWTGSGFSNPTVISTISIAGATWMGPDIAAQGDTVFAVYKEFPEADTNSHVWCRASLNGGMTFNAPVRVDNIGDNVCRFPTVSVDDQGNPIVGFMRFDPGFGDARWVVSKSTDGGQTFVPDVLASGWSSGTSEVCDCCPSKIVSKGNTVAMPYRDNNNNIRDTWVGISTDGGASFSGGMDVDQQAWSIMSCPSSGPDAVFVGDQLYTTYMSAASGSSMVYYNVSAVAALTGSPALPLDQSTPTSLSSQNFPRVDEDLNSMAFVWKQISNGQQELALQFTSNISGGINSVQEIIDTDFVGAVDVLLDKGTIWVIWEDVNSGTVKYRRGSFTGNLGFNQSENLRTTIQVQPNPSSGSWTITGLAQSQDIYFELLSMGGEVIEQESVPSVNGVINFEIVNTSLSSGVYYLRIYDDQFSETVKLLKQ
jgi:hypothetical protein